MFENEIAALQTIWSEGGWEYAILVLNIALAYYAYSNYQDLTKLGNIHAHVAQIADQTARASALGRISRRRTIERRLSQVDAAVNHTLRYVMQRVGRVIVFGILIPMLIIAAIVVVVSDLSLVEAGIFTLNHLTRGLFLDALDVFGTTLLGDTAEPTLNARILSLIVILRFTAEATFWFSLFAAVGGLLGAITLRIPYFQPDSIKTLNEKLSKARERVRS